MTAMRHKQTGDVLHPRPGGVLDGARLRDLKLAGADLRRASLRGADLWHADLSGADLENASLVEAHAAEPCPMRRGRIELFCTIAGCCVVYALALAIHAPGDWGLRYLFSAPWIVVFLLMRHAVLMATHHPEPGASVTLRGANLRGADLTDADLRYGNLEAVFLRDANLSRANLRGAILRRAALERVALPDADLSRADLREADLQSARAAGADLQLADLRRANLRGADLRQANARYADLREADLRGADLRAQLDGAKLKRARFDETTRWPASFQPARHGCLTAAEVAPAAAPHGRGDEPSGAGGSRTANEAS